MPQPNTSRRLLQCLCLSLLALTAALCAHAQQITKAFSPTQVVHANAIPGATLADFDGDGHADLAYISTPGRPLWYGDPIWWNVYVQLHFGSREPVTVRTRINPCGYYDLDYPTYGYSPLVAGDLNNDGKIDLVYSCLNAIYHEGDVSTTYVLLGKGDGTFEPPVAYSLTPGYHAAPSLVLADLNGDGYLDMALSSNKSGAIAVALNGGSTSPATFKTVFNYYNGIAYQSSLHVADLNGDGIPDLVEPGIFALYGNGDGTFQAPKYKRSGLHGSNFAVGDFDGDGHPDVAGQTASTNIYTPYNFAMNLGSDIGFSIHTIKLGSPSFDIPASLYSSEFISADGIASLIATNDLASVIHANGKGGFDEHDYSAAWGAPIGVADVNDDGKPDLVLQAFGSGSFIVLRGNNDGTLQSNPATYLPYSQYGPAPVAADFNGDGVADLLYPPISYKYIGIGIGKGDGTFTRDDQAIAVPIQVSAPFSYSNAVADFNGDGKADIAFVFPGARNNQLYVYPGKGDGTFQAPLPPFDLGFAGAQFILIGDFNGDGRRDLLIGYALRNDVEYYKYFGKGDGTFGPPVLSTAILERIVAFTPVVTDLDHDGKDDYVYSGAEGLTANLGKGGEEVLNLPSSPQIALGDINGDGYPDAVIDSGIYLNDGTGNFNPKPVYVPPTNPNGQPPVSLVVGDVNADGSPDVVEMQITSTYGQYNDYIGTYSALIFYGDNKGNFTPDENSYLIGTGGESYDPRSTPFSTLTRVNKNALTHKALDLLVAFPGLYATSIINKNHPQP